MTANHYQAKHSAKYGTLFTERMRLALVAVPVSALLSQKALLTYMVVNVPCAIQNQVLSLVLQFIADAQLPLEQRAHFYTLLTGVCASCGAYSLDNKSPGCFASLRSVQGAAPLATFARLSLVDLPSANSIKCCSPPASLKATKMNFMEQTNRDL